MTATLTPAQGHAALRDRLAALRAEHARTLSEITSDGSGDVADRATNVDGHVRLAMLDERIAAVERELANTGPRPRREPRDTVALGDLVTVDLGDGPETFRLGSLDGAVGVDVITPGSPLGKALLGAAVGSTVAYSPRSGRTLHATVLTVNDEQAA